MENNPGRKAVVAACMESPFYFSVPLKNRLELLKQIEQRSALCSLRQDFLSWIKTGIFIYSGAISPPHQLGRTT
jgi:hypothetical protein